MQIYCNREGFDVKSDSKETLILFQSKNRYPWEPTAAIVMNPELGLVLQRNVIITRSTRVEARLLMARQWRQTHQGDGRVVTRYMGSGIKGLKKGGIRDHSPGSGITRPGIRISGVLHWIKDQALWITKGIHDAHLNRVFFLKAFLTFYGPSHTVILGIWTS